MKVMCSKRSMLLLGLMMFGVILAGCHKKKSNDTSSGGGVPAPAPDVDFNISGTWSGTASNGEPMSFSVVGKNIVSDQFAFLLLGKQCGYETTHTTTGESIPVIDNKFDDKTTSSTVFSGVFESDTSATGTFMYADTICMGEISMTWTAKKISSSAISGLSFASRKNVAVDKRPLR